MTTNLWEALIGPVERVQVEWVQIERRIATQADVLRRSFVQST